MSTERPAQDPGHIKDIGHLSAVTCAILNSTIFAMIDTESLDFNFAQALIRGLEAFADIYETGSENCEPLPRAAEQLRKTVQRVRETMQEALAP